MKVIIIIIIKKEVTVAVTIIIIIISRSQFTTIEFSDKKLVQYCSLGPVYEFACT